MNEEDRERIRRSYYVEKQSIHQIARAEGRNRITIRKALADTPKPSIPPSRKKPQPVFGAYKERVGQLLQENERLPRKQRYTAHRIFEIIRGEGYQGVNRRFACTLLATSKPRTRLTYSSRWNMIQGGMRRWIGEKPTPSSGVCAKKCNCS